MTQNFALAICLFGIVTANGGCTNDGGKTSVLHRAALGVSPAVLDQYVGTYRLASGAHFPVVRDGTRLLGGTPLHELFAQTTRQFRSNRLPGEFNFERSTAGGPVTLRRRLGKRDYFCQRVDPDVDRDPTIRISAGDHALRMLIVGSGEPIIVLEDGFGGGVDHHAEIQAELAKITTVVAYDHAATGGSDASSHPHDARQSARELRRALENGGLKEPFLLIGASIGADYIRIFAHEHPNDTAGLILLDPTPDWDLLIEWSNSHAPKRVDMFRQLIHDSNRMMDELMSVQETGRSAQWIGLTTTRADARRAFPLPDVPIVQITGAGGRETTPAVDDKIRFFEYWLQQHLPQAKHVLARHSGHSVWITDRKLVVEEVRQLVATLRKRPLGSHASRDAQRKS